VDNPDQIPRLSSLPAGGLGSIEPQPYAHDELAEIGPNNPPWGLGAAILTWLASVIFLVVFQLGFVFAYVAYRGISIADLPKFIQEDQTAIFLTVLSIIPTHLLTLLVVWAVVTRLGKFLFKQVIGWSWGRGLNFWTSSLMAILLLVMGWILTWIFGDQKTALDEMIAKSVPARYTIAFLATFTAPLVEELVYRGVLYSALQRLTGPFWAVISVLALFTLVHVPQYYPNFGVIITIGLLSFFLTVVRAYSGRILPCIVIHMVFNGIQSIIIILNPYLEGVPKTPVPTGAFLTGIFKAVQLLAF
jgi:membrane protease YdiL (CAAX protease family)